MERIKKIEQWIGFKSDYFKGALTILWILWAFVQMNSISMPKWETKPFDFEMEKAASQEIIAFYNRVEDAAKLKGENYGPKDYFEDYKLIEAERGKFRKKYPDSRNLAMDGYGPTTPFFNLQQRIEANRICGKFSYQDIDHEAQAFREWKMGGSSEGEEVRKKFQGLDLWNKICTFMSWLLIFYLRSLPLSLGWYLIRMCERKGILETVLADKKKFALAVVGWPALIWSYPFNILREIRVEAELRRLGDIFRQFGSAEREFVQKIANSGEYEQWIVSYRTKNQGRFRHGLLVALAVTIVISSVAPAFALGLTLSGVDLPVRFQTVVISDYHGSGGAFESDGDPVRALPESRFEIFFEKVGRLFRKAESIAEQTIARCIEHVPLGGSQVLGEVFPIT